MAERIDADGWRLVANKRLLLEAAYTGAWAGRQHTLSEDGLRRLLDPRPAVRVLSGEEAEKAARDHAELSALFDSLAETQRRARAAKAAGEKGAPGTPGSPAEAPGGGGLQPQGGPGAAASQATADGAAGVPEGKGG